MGLRTRRSPRSVSNQQALPGGKRAQTVFNAVQELKQAAGSRYVPVTAQELTALTEIRPDDVRLGVRTLLKKKLISENDVDLKTTPPSNRRLARKLDTRTPLALGRMEARILDQAGSSKASSFSDLARNLKANPGSVWRALKSLEEKGFSQEQLAGSEAPFQRKQARTTKPSKRGPGRGHHAFGAQTLRTLQAIQQLKKDAGKRYVPVTPQELQALIRIPSGHIRHHVSLLLRKKIISRRDVDMRPSGRAPQQRLARTLRTRQPLVLGSVEARILELAGSSGQKPRSIQGLREASGKNRGEIYLAIRTLEKKGFKRKKLIGPGTPHQKPSPIQDLAEKEIKAAVAAGGKPTVKEISLMIQRGTDQTHQIVRKLEETGKIPRGAVDMTPRWSPKGGGALARNLRTRTPISLNNFETSIISASARFQAANKRLPTYKELAQELKANYQNVFYSVSSLARKGFDNSKLVSQEHAIRPKQPGAPRAPAKPTRPPGSLRAQTQPARPPALIPPAGVQEKAAQEATQPSASLMPEGISDDERQVINFLRGGRPASPLAIAMQLGAGWNAARADRALNALSARKTHDKEGHVKKVFEEELNKVPGWGRPARRRTAAQKAEAQTMRQLAEDEAFEGPQRRESVDEEVMRILREKDQVKKERRKAA